MDRAACAIRWWQGGSAQARLKSRRLRPSCSEGVRALRLRLLHFHGRKAKFLGRGVA